MADLVAIDPGGTTGIAVFERGKLVDVYDCIHLAELCAFLNRSLDPRVTVICEDFISIRLTSDGRSTIKLIGMIQALCLLHTGRLPILQVNQARRPFLPQAARMLSLYDPQRHWLQHHKDAVSHGLCYLHSTGARS